MRPGAATAGLVALVLGAATPARGEVDSWRLDLEAGSEYDSNVHRLELAPGDQREVEDAPLGRVGGRLRARWRSGARDRLAVDAFAGAKVFAGRDAQSENVAVVSSSARYDRRLGDRKVLVGAAGSYYDALGVDPFGTGGGGEGRNFRLAAADALLTVPGPRGHRLTGAVGARDFVYKPDADFDWRGESYALAYHATLWRGDPDQEVDAASIDVSASYRLGRRRYAGVAFTNACPDEQEAEPNCFVPTRAGRVDLDHGLGAELVYTGDRIYSGRYDLQVIDSNSYGQSLVRQRVEAAVTTELFRGIFLTGRGVVRLNLFLDPLLLAPDVQSQSFVSIEDENRNTLSLHLSRDLGDRLALEARYAIYSNEFATEELSFRRQTMYLGLVYSAGRR